MKTLRFTAFVALVPLVLLTSCKKTTERELEREKDRLTGTWTVNKMRYVLTDTLGKTLRDSAVTNAGTLEFSQAKEDAETPFHPVVFRGACKTTELTQYFSRFGAGESTTDGGFVLYWDADPAAERLMLWAIGPSSSYHRVLNFDGDGDSRTMWYMLPQAGGAGRQFFYFDMEK